MEPKQDVLLGTETQTRKCDKKGGRELARDDTGMPSAQRRRHGCRQPISADFCRFPTLSDT
eukprot:scaffold263985_cov24-Attheya_sp.AAC.2